MIVINIILVLLILSSLGGVSTNYLYCGIWGCSIKKGRKADLKKLLILGLYNRTRGTDSCGYYYNGNIVKGVDKESDFKDFIVNNHFFPGVLPGEIVMCHARKSTYGSHTEVNAHPHQVGNLVQTHNGTIKNIWTLCREHGISHTDIHVDSIGLAHIIQKDGFGVLSEYEGYAALTHVFIDDPESLYLYHGASREKEKETVYEERPLFFLQTNEGLYYSSMVEALHMINNTKSKPKILAHNAVYKVQYGEFVEKVQDVDRVNNNITKVYNYNNYAVNNVHVQTPPKDNKKNATNTTPTGKVKEIPFVNVDERSIIFKETDPPEAGYNKIYYKFGRFHKHDWICFNGVWAEVEVLLQGKYLIDRKNSILKDATETTHVKSEDYYFVRGIMMKDKEAYEKCLEQRSTWEALDYNAAFILSAYSKYPITSYINEGKEITNVLRNAWYLDHKRFTGEVEPKFTKRKYKIKHGLFDTIIRPSNTPEAIDINIKIDDTRDVYVDNLTAAKSPDIERSEPYREIYDTIANWADTIVKDDDVTTLPECFLLFLESYASEIDATNAQTEASRFNETVLFLTDMIENKKTLLEVFKDYFEKPDALNIDLVKRYFKKYTPEQINEMPNRFTLLPFQFVEEGILSCNNDTCTMPDPKLALPNSTSDVTMEKPKTATAEEVQKVAEALAKEVTSLAVEKEEKKEVLKHIEKIQQQLTHLQEEADALQALDSSDQAQNIAFCMYRTKEMLEKTLAEEQEKLK